MSIITSILRRQPINFELLTHLRPVSTTVSISNLEPVGLFLSDLVMVDVVRHSSVLEVGVAVAACSHEELIRLGVLNRIPSEANGGSICLSNV